MSDEPKLEELDRLIAMGKQKGFLTYDEVNDALPSDIVSLDQLDDIMMMFGAMDIEVVDSAKAGRLPSEIGRPRRPPSRTTTATAPSRSTSRPGPVGRTEDPVRLYLREMGRVALLTREGEITLAKRIEEGKDEVTGAILSTNLALEQIRELREQLRQRRHLRSRTWWTSTRRSSPRRRRAALRRSVVSALGDVDRLLRERDKLLEQVRKLRGTRRQGQAQAEGKAEPAWKKFEQAGPAAPAARCSRSSAR